MPIQGEQREGLLTCYKCKLRLNRVGFRLFYKHVLDKSLILASFRTVDSAASRRVSWKMSRKGKKSALKEKSFPVVIA